MSGRMTTKTIIALSAPMFAIVLNGCDARVSTAPPVVEKKETTIINPPAEKTVEKKVETNTTIVNPPGEKK